MKSYSIALIPGDGIGQDVTDAAWQVLSTVARHSGFTLTGTSFPWSCAFYKETGAMMPADGIEALRPFDAILLGSVGWPARCRIPSRCTACCCQSARPSCNMRISGRIDCCRASKDR